MQMICIWSTDATATPSSLAPVKSRVVYFSGTGLPRLFLEKRPINGCSVVVVLWHVTLSWILAHRTLFLKFAGILKICIFRNLNKWLNTYPCSMTEALLCDIIYMVTTLQTKTTLTLSWLLKFQLEMWANAQRDGRPAEYRWRPLFNAAKFG